jgi:hypothetical protein
MFRIALVYRVIKNNRLTILNLIYSKSKSLSMKIALIIFVLPAIITKF